MLEETYKWCTALGHAAASPPAYTQLVLGLNIYTAAHGAASFAMALRFCYAE